MKELELFKNNEIITEVQYEILLKDHKLVDYLDAEEIQPLSDSIEGLEEDYIDIEFDASVPKADQTDYRLAAASGVISGVLSVFWSEKFDLENAHKWGNEKADEIVVKVANHCGYKGNDLKKAIEHLEKNYKMAGDSLKDEFGGGKQHHLRDFSHHASPVGLICSILMQFTGRGLGTDTQGNIIRPKISKDELIGKDFSQKLLFGTVNWILHLISDFDGSSGSVISGNGKGTGIPGPILSLLKELSSLPIFKKVDEGNINKPKAFSAYVSKIFNGTKFRNENGEIIRFDLRTEMGIGHFISNQSKPVIINECIVRAVFFLRRFIDEVKEKNISSIMELNQLDASKFIPMNNRALTRMITVASTAFVLTNMSGTALKSLVASKGIKEAAVGEFFLRVNYVGIGRFYFACRADAEYIKEDLREVYEKHISSVEKFKQSQFSFGANFLSLTEKQTRILFSLKSLAIEYDIGNTNDAKTAFIKKEWVNRWRDATVKSFDIHDETYFLEEDALYDVISKESATNKSQGWMYLISLELALFQPYYSLSEEDKDLFKGIKYKNRYLPDEYVNKQDIILKEDFSEIIKNYKSFQGKVKETSKKTVAQAVKVVGTTAIAGGLALAFAPEIAVVLAGETVAGLSGAALTSASLATIGGGSLAVGGLGMAGGTAILTGGGALIGLAGSGSATLLSVLGEITENYTLNECCKLLTFCKMVVIEKHNKPEMLNYVIAGLEGCANQIQDAIEEETDDSKAEKQKKKRLELCLRYVNNTVFELDRMIAGEKGLAIAFFREK